MGEKFGILRLLRIYHSTSRVKGLGFDLLLNLGAGSENHCVQKNGPQFCTFPTGYNGTQSLSVGFFMSRGRAAEALQVACCPFLFVELPVRGSSRAAGSPLYTLPC